VKPRTRGSATVGGSSPVKRGGNTLKPFKGLSPESQDQNLVLTVLYVPSSLDSGYTVRFPNTTCVPLPSDLEHNKTVKARFWSWSFRVQGESQRTFKLFPFAR